MSIAELPNDIIINITTFLTTPGKNKVTHVCKQWREAIAANKHFWQLLFISQYHPLVLKHKFELRTDKDEEYWKRCCIIRFYRNENYLVYKRCSAVPKPYILDHRIEQEIDSRGIKDALVRLDIKNYLMYLYRQSNNSSYCDWTDDMLTVYVKEYDAYNGGNYFVCINIYGQPLEFEFTGKEINVVGVDLARLGQVVTVQMSESHIAFLNDNLYIKEYEAIKLLGWLGKGASVISTWCSLLKFPY
jgi:hypothetical protein